MNTLLIFFAFPIAVIIFSVVLQKLLHNPVAVSALIFAIFIVITFAFFDETFLIATLAYTILAFITALLVCRLNSNNNDNNNNNSNTCPNTFTDTLADTITNASTTTFNTNQKQTIPDDDNVINNNCGYMYNRRCRKF